MIRAEPHHGLYLTYGLFDARIASLPSATNEATYRLASGPSSAGKILITADLPKALLLYCAYQSNLVAADVLQLH